jgi:hypothetical protein
MFEKWRIKEHMDVADSTGRHVGTVDSVDDSRIKLTRSDSSDGAHHYVDIDSVETIEDNRLTLKVGTPLPAQFEGANAGSPAERAALGGEAAERSGAARQAVGDDVNYSRHTSSTNPPGEDRALFGTSGQGTGMGGSGSGTEN